MSEETRGRLRLMPALVILAVQWCVSYYYQAYGSTNNDVVIGNIGTTLIGTILLIVWWLAASRASWRDKFAGLALFGVAVAVIVLTHLPKGAFLLIKALPALTLGMVAILFVSQALKLPFWRALIMVYVVICVCVFGMMRIVTLGGDLSVDTAWIWEKGAMPSTEMPADAYVEIHGTATLPAAVTAGDWPGFRGPNRDGRVEGVTFATDWEKSPPREVWRRPVGAGHSSMSVVGDYLFTQEQVGAVELVSCYSTKTGEPVWTNSLNTRHDDTLGGVGPRATPTYSNGKVYAQSTAGLLQCLDAATGSVVWTKEMTTPTAPDPPQYGFASSPLALGELVIQYASGAGRHDMVALNAMTGDEVWSAANGTGGYGSPHFAELAGVKQVLLLNSDGAQGYDPANGAKLWEHAWPKKQFPRCVQPILCPGDRLALGGNSDFGTRLISVANTGGAWDVKAEWTNAKHRPYFNDNVRVKDALYGFDGNRLCCVELAKGETTWQGDRCGGQVLALPDMELVLVLTEKGEVSLVKADPSAYTEVATFKAISGKTWNHPIIANGYLFVRNSTEMACFAL